LSLASGSGELAATAAVSGAPGIRRFRSTAAHASTSTQLVITSKYAPASLMPTAQTWCETEPEGRGLKKCTGSATPASAAIATAIHHRQSNITRSVFLHGSRQPHCADATTCGITFAGTTIHLKIQTSVVIQS